MAVEQDVELRRAARGRVDAAREVLDHRARVVELGDQRQGIRRVDPAAVDAVALDVELAVVRVIERVRHRIAAARGHHRRVLGDVEERIAQGLGRRGPPEHAHLVVARHEVELRRLRGEREQELAVEHLLRHQRLAQQRSGHHVDRVLHHRAVLVGAAEAAVAGDRVHRVGAGVERRRAAQPGRIARAQIAGARAGARAGDDWRGKDVGHDDRAELAWAERQRT